MLLELINVEKSFIDKHVLKGVSFDVSEGEIVVILGPSGCGKTTLLRIIAGLDRPDAGKLLLGGQDLSRIPVHERNFGMVFQDYALFPHKNVADNVSFGLRMSGWELRERDKRVTQVLELVGLVGYGERRVYELSGGEQQRVALARSLAPSPRLMLLDEPLGSLDRALREHLMGELRTILKAAGGVLRAGKKDYSAPVVQIDNEKKSPQPPSRGVTSIYVTHDQEEAFAIADRVLVMNAGIVEQMGTPLELYCHPRNAFVARFLGMENLLEATVLSQEPPIVRTAIGDLLVGHLTEPPGTQATLLIRPEAGQVWIDGTGNGNVVIGRPIDVSFRGRLQVVTILVMTDQGEEQLKFSFESTVNLPTDREKLAIKLEPSKLLTIINDH